MQWSYGTSFEGGPDVYEPLVTDRPDFHRVERHGWLRRDAARNGLHVYLRQRRRRLEHAAIRFPRRCCESACLPSGSSFASIGITLAENTDIGGVEDSVSGAEDLGLGMKLALTPQECLLAGDGDHSADDGAQRVRPISRPTKCCLDSTICTAGTSTRNGRPAARRPQWRDGRRDARLVFTEFSQSWTVGHSVDRTHRQLCGVVRDRADERRHEPHRELFQRRVHYLFNNDLQWDIRAGVGLNEAADDFFAGSGLSFRYW